MDKFLSYLPEEVHVQFSWNKGPNFFGDYDHYTLSTIKLPKTWLKHGRHGSYNEWEIKETYKKQLANKFGQKYAKEIDKLEVLEWNLLENMAVTLIYANNIGFTNIFNIAKEVDTKDAIYYHNTGIAPTEH